MNEDDKRSQGSERPNRAKRQNKAGSRSQKSSVPYGAIQAPPRVALASDKHEQDERVYSQLERGRGQLPVSPGPGISKASHAHDGRETRSRPNPKPAEFNAQSQNIAFLAERLEALQQENGRLIGKIEQLARQEECCRDIINELNEKLCVLTVERDTQGGLAVLEDGVDGEKQHERTREHTYRLEESLRTLDRKLHECETSWKVELEMKTAKMMVEREQLLEQLHAAQKDAIASEEATKSYRQQLLELKQNISTLTHMNFQVTDVDIVEQMTQLYHESRDWVVNNFRRSKIDFATVSGLSIKMIQKTAPRCQLLPSTARLSLLQAVLCAYMMEIFEDRCLFGLPTTGPLASTRILHDYFESTSESFFHWRSFTLQMILRSEDVSVREYTDVLVRGIVQRISQTLFEMTGVDVTKQDVMGLRRLVEQAVHTARLLNVQSSPYLVNIPSFEFDPSLMEDVGATEDECVISKPVACVLAPVIYKFGKHAETGSATVHSAIVKARVILDAGM